METESSSESPRPESPTRILMQITCRSFGSASGYTEISRSACHPSLKSNILSSSSRVETDVCVLRSLDAQPWAKITWLEVDRDCARHGSNSGNSAQSPATAVALPATLFPPTRQWLGRLSTILASPLATTNASVDFVPGLLNSPTSSNLDINNSNFYLVTSPPWVHMHFHSGAANVYSVLNE